MHTPTTLWRPSEVKMQRIVSGGSTISTRFPPSKCPYQRLDTHLVLYSFSIHLYTFPRPYLDWASAHCPCVVFQRTIIGVLIVDISYLHQCCINIFPNVSNTLMWLTLWLYLPKAPRILLEFHSFVIYLFITRYIWNLITLHQILMQPYGYC